MYRKFFIFLSSFLLSIILIMASSPFVSALEDYRMVSSPIGQPNISTYSSYAEVVCLDSATNELYSYIFLVSFHSTTTTPSARVDHTSNKNIRIYNGSEDGIMTVACVTKTGAVWTYSPVLTYTGYIEQNFSSVEIVSVKLYGFLFANQYPYNTQSCSIMYGSDNESFVLLESIRNLLLSNADSLSLQIQNDNLNTDRILDAGSDNAQPDFDSANGKLDDTVGQIESIEGSYQIDQAATNTALSTGSSFLQGSDMQRASIQVKTWIERFSSENRVVTGFLIAAMVLGLCFWVIGRKAGSE